MRWTQVPLWTLYRRVEDFGRPDLPLLSVYRDHGVVLREGRLDNFNKPSDDLANYKVVRPGDLVLNKMKTWQGSLGVSDHEGIVSPAYFVGRRVGAINDRFMHHLLRSKPLIAEYGARSKGIRPSQWDLSWDEFAAIRVRLPSRSQQRAIADFLDTETARIDALTIKKRRLVEILAERRITVLMGGFTASRRWRLKRLLRAPMAYGVLVPRFVDPGEGARMIRINALTRNGRVHADRLAWIEHEQSMQYRRTIVSAGDLVLSVVGSMGRSAVVERDVAGANLNRPLARLQPRPELPVRLLWHWTQTPQFADQAMLATGGDTAQPTLNLGDLAGFTVGLPDDPDVWSDLLDSFDRVLAPLDAVERRLSVQMRLLQERRQALITAAVTGQLDIPGLAA